MITARKETYVYSLLEFLGVVGEFPFRSLSLLGNERVLKTLINKCRKEQQVRMSVGGIVYTLSLFNVSGHGKLKTLRLSKDALVLLERIHPKALGYYLGSFREHHFTGNEMNIDRNHRIAETAAMCRRAGAEFRPYVLPELQTQHIIPLVDQSPCWYQSRQVKQSEDDDMRKIGFTRSTGLLFGPDRVFTLYNARNSLMKWSGTGEYKAYHQFYELARFNSGIEDLDSAILFAQNSTSAISTLLETEKINRLDTPFSSIYRHIYFVPLNEDGIVLLKLLLQKDFRTRLVNALLPESVRSKSRNMSIDCDGESGGHYILSHLDGDLVRLINFSRNSQSMPETLTFEVVCYPWQREYVHKLVGEDIKLTFIPTKTIMESIICC